MFYDKLINTGRAQKKWKVLPRVHRWKTENEWEIRQFEDKIGNHIVKQYEHISSKDLMLLRTKHYLPETERLLYKNYRKIYAMCTERGYGVIAKLTTSDGVTREGRLFFGCDNKHYVFHRFFEERDSEHFFKVTLPRKNHPR